MLAVHCKSTSQKIISWLSETVKISGFEKVIVALSGGIDSAVAASLAVKALGKENVYIIMLPYGDLHTQGLEDARSVTDFLNIPQAQIFTIDIKNAVDGIVKNAFTSNPPRYAEFISASSQNQKKRSRNKFGMTNGNMRKGNIMARVRMIFLFDLAKKLPALVCGTENRTEHYLGYFTRFGDEASDIEPIRNLYKTQVREMAKYLGVPEKIITKAPTAGLWEGQTDEDELGFTYKDADQILFSYFDQKLTIEEIAKKGIAKKTIIKVLDHVAKNDFKHKLPFILE